MATVEQTKVIQEELEKHMGTCGDCTDFDLCKHGEAIQAQGMHSQVSGTAMFAIIRDLYEFYRLHDWMLSYEGISTFLAKDKRSAARRSWDALSVEFYGKSENLKSLLKRLPAPELLECVTAFCDAVDSKSDRDKALQEAKEKALVLISNISAGEEFRRVPPSWERKAIEAPTKS
jgi:hypothetical protein